MSGDSVARLSEWGRGCRGESVRLGLPRISQIQVMIDYVLREERLARGVKRKRLRQTQAVRESKPAQRNKVPMMSSQVLEVDHIVANLPTWMRTVLIRSYLYGQPDKTAAQDLRMPKWMYRNARLAAEEEVGLRLAKPIARATIPADAVPGNVERADRPAANSAGKVSSR